MNDVNRRLRELPHLDAVLSCEQGQKLQEQFRRSFIVSQARQLISEIRSGLLQGSYAGSTSENDVALMLAGRLEKLLEPAVKRVVNATGILLHTNLGRAVLTEGARRAIEQVSTGYCSLEFDLASGQRGKRDSQLARQLSALCGCEDATVVNNCAAAVMIALNTMAAGREVVTSRGELVEIGGSYRVPDVIPASGCRLREIGTTNRTRIRDYELAITENTGVLLKTHASNYRIRGFVEEASVAELVALGSQYAVPVLVDLGSGYIRHGSQGELDEPELLDTLAAGPDLVCISGDKLLGGPQAGIILGRREWIARIRKNPLWRVLRLDKLCISALSATLENYMLASGEGASSVLARQLETDTELLEERAANLATALRDIRPDWNFEVASAEGSVGGGSLPDQDFESRVVSVSAGELSAEAIDTALRHARVPVVGYVSQSRLLLNVASLLPGEDELIIRAFEELDA